MQSTFELRISRYNIFNIFKKLKEQVMRNLVLHFQAL